MRRTFILALLLTTVLLLTLDLRGNPAIDAAREGFTQVMRPVETATQVVTNPIERVWNGIVNYDDLEQENIALQEQVDRLIEAGGELLRNNPEFQRLLSDLEADRRQTLEQGPSQSPGSALAQQPK